MHRTKEPPLYVALANQLAEMIQQGTFRPGERIPSVRQTCQQHHVSVPTVVQAYTVLEDRRLIEARPKSGFYVRAVLPGSAPASFVRRTPQPKSLAKFPPLMALAHDVVNPEFARLGGAHPSPDILPGKKLARLMASLARQHTDAVTLCDPAPGCARLRVELSRRALDWGCYLTPDDFLITNGATEAMFLALSAVTKPGDTIIVEAPTHHGVLHIMSQLGLRAVAVPASEAEGIDLDAVERILSREPIAAIVVIPNFNNPLGCLMPDANRARLLALAEAHKTPVIEDDVYGDLHGSGERPRCLKSLDKDGGVILLGSFSKTLAPGYRVGYLVAGPHHERLLRTKMALNSSNPLLTALTIAEFLKTGGYEHHLRGLRRLFREEITRMREAVLAYFPPGTTVTHPAGGFLLWVGLPGKADALALFERAREQKISIAPGHLFSPAAEFRNYIRLNCAQRWDRRTEDAVRLLGRLAARDAA